MRSQRVDVTIWIDAETKALAEFALDDELQELVDHGRIADYLLEDME